MVRLGKGQQRHELLGTKFAVSKEKTLVCSSVESHTQCFSSQVLHARDQEVLRDTAENGPLEGKPAGKALVTAHLVCDHGNRGRGPMCDRLPCVEFLNAMMYIVCSDLLYALLFLNIGDSECLKFKGFST